MRMRLVNLLESNGYETVEAENGLEAIARYREAKPDAVLLDITMPEMDGLTALKEIKKVDANALVVMVTAIGQQAMVVEALKSGAKDFILKPYNEGRVLSAVQKLFG
jgi:two-component system, chemotaxis family, chemotaxis protein CheY